MLKVFFIIEKFTSFLIQHTISKMVIVLIFMMTVAGKFQPGG